LYSCVDALGKRRSPILLNIATAHSQLKPAKAAIGIITKGLAGVLGLLVVPLKLNNPAIITKYIIAPKIPPRQLEPSK
jgi:hypothetical protein